MRSVALVLLAACSSPALPAATELGRYVVAVDAFDGQLYWVEVGDVQAVHGPAGTLWEEPISDRRAYYLTAGEDGAVMSSVNPFENCGDTIWIHPDGDVDTLPLNDGGGCDARPFDVFGGQLLYEISRTSRAVERFDLATRTSEPAFDLGMGSMWAHASAASEVFALGDAPAERQHTIFAFSRERPTSRRIVVQDLPGAYHLALAGDDVYWVLAGAGGMVQRAPQSALGAAPETIATLGVEVRALAAGGGALWLAPASRRELWRLDLDGSVTRYDVPYVPLSLDTVGDQLAVTTADEQRRLVLQPLD